MSFLDTTSLCGFGSFPYIDSVIKSVQTGEITIASGSASNTASITAVDPRFSIVLFAGWYSAATTYNPSTCEPRLTLTNSTTVTAATNASNATFSRVSRYIVIEFQPWAIKSIQTGTLAVNSTSNNATITAVDTTNSLLITSGFSSTRTSNNWVNQGRLNLTNSTTVNGSRASSSGTDTFGYSVIEFYPGILKSVQYSTATVAASSATGDATISAVVDANAITFWLGYTMSIFSDSWPSDHCYIQRTSTTNVRTTRGVALSTQLDSTCVTVEFYPQFVKSHATFTKAIGTGNSTNTQTITAVDTNKTILSYLGWTGTTFSDNDTLPHSILNIGLTNSTTVTLNRGSNSGTINVTGAFEYLETKL